MHQDGLPTRQRSVRQLSGSAYLVSMCWLIEVFYRLIGRDFLDRLSLELAPAAALGFLRPANERDSAHACSPF